METRDRGEPMDEDTDEGDQRAERHESQSSHPASTPSVAAAPASDESPAAAGEGGAPANAAAANLNKRRRGLGVVTPTACTECRKKRAKCDGRKPCGRCKVQKEVECVYEQPVRQSKENLRTEIEVLKRQQRSNDIVIKALVQPELWEGVLQRLHTGEPVNNIADWLGDATTLAARPFLAEKIKRESTGSRGGGGASGSGAEKGSPSGSFARSARPPVMSISTLTGFPTAQATSPYSPMRSMQSPVPAQGAFGQPIPEVDRGSPWSAKSHSATSLTVSNRRDSQSEAMAWSADLHQSQQQQQQQQHPSQFPQRHRQHQQEQPRHHQSQPQHTYLPHHQRPSHQRTFQAEETGPRPPWMLPPMAQSRRDPWSENEEGNNSGEMYPRPGPSASGDPLATDLPEMNVPASTWTDITSDSSLVQHLLSLYFCWEYPTFASLSKEQFLEDFRQGRHRYCSPILVNALLALGCRFSTRPNTRANPDDPYTSGDHFFRECQRLFYQQEEHHALTTIQALGIMSIREASSGRDSESWYYAGQSIRLAFEMGLHRVDEATGDEDEIAVQSATFWGAFALDHAWSLATGSLPQSSLFPRLPPKPNIIEDIEASLWVPYTGDDEPLQRSMEQPSNVRSVYKCFCELSELVHQSLYILYSPGRPLTSRDLLSIYTQYLNWYDKIPEVLRLGHNFTPAVLFAHMYYHFAILLLFRPLIKLRIIGSNILPRDVCCQAADAIQSLLHHYSKLYTLRRTPSFVPYFLLTSSITHLAIGASTPPSEATSSSATPASHSNPSTAETPLQPSSHVSPSAQQHQPVHQQLLPGQQQQQQTQVPSQQRPEQDGLTTSVAKTITRAIADLTEMAPCHHFAVQALNILRYLAKKWNIPVNMDDPIPKREGDGSTSTGGSRGARSKEQQLQDIEKAVRPVTNSRNFFAPNVQEGDTMCMWDLTRRTGPGSGGRGSIVIARSEAESTRAGPTAGLEASVETPSKTSGDALENPLFWPFPLQGRPMLATGPLLEEAGFALL